MIQQARSVLGDGDAVAMLMRMHCSPRSSGQRCDEIPPAHQVVGRGAKRKLPIDEASAAVSQLAEERDRLQPAERLLDQLPLAMTQAISRMSRGAGIDRTAAVAEFVFARRAE